MPEPVVVAGGAGDWEVTHFVDDIGNPWTSVILYDAAAEDRNNDGEQVPVYSLLLSDVEAKQFATALTDKQHEHKGVTDV